MKRTTIFVRNLAIASDIAAINLKSEMKSALQTRKNHINPTTTTKSTHPTRERQNLIFTQ